MRVALDTETSGLTAGYHEILEIAIVPLDDNYFPDPNVPVFHTKVRPEFPERIQLGALIANGRVSKENKDDPNAFEAAKKEMESYPTRRETIGAFLEWYKENVLPTGKKQMSPLAHNWHFDSSFLEHWFLPSHKDGISFIGTYFHYQARDTQRIVMYLQDRSIVKKVPTPFPGTSLTKVTGHFEIEHSAAHTAMGDAIATAAVYRRLCDIKDDLAPAPRS